MSYTTLNDDKLAQMYRDEETLNTIRKEFNITTGTVYRHLKANGIKPNRKQSIPWTEEEEQQLITAHDERLTGAELCKRVPTRTPAAIKSHVQKLRLFKLIGNQKVYKV